MKYIFIVIFLFPLTISSQEKYERKFYELSERIDFKIISYSKSKMVDVGTTGGGGTVYEKAKKGYKSIFIWFKIKNKTDEKIVFDLRQFQVVDEDLNVYDAYLCAGNGLNMNDCENYEFKIKPNKGRQARIYFQPQIPKETKLKYLRVKGNDLIEF
ncbi:DUF4352 domain-containing protein [Winogradskyella sp.]|uniref:DUF4352 domain-containing protein n=1 Tax=Winogradskyella sp. TaxID=1883156 RepID=UPI0025D013F3|nr:DUF4352 domain-containing protein [Winogradskyella sp.]